MWPFRTSAATYRARRLRKLRAAQRHGRACVRCGSRQPMPTVPTRINQPGGGYLGGFAHRTCPNATAPQLALTTGGAE